jgi:hypothetical protein
MKWLVPLSSIWIQIKKNSREIEIFSYVIYFEVEMGLIQIDVLKRVVNVFEKVPASLVHVPVACCNYFRIHL